jgi:hypothetical protein
VAVLFEVPNQPRTAEMYHTEREGARSNQLVVLEANEPLNLDMVIVVGSVG